MFDDDRYQMDVWLVVPAYATGSSMEGARRYTWRVEFAKVATFAKSGFKSKEEVTACCQRRNQQNAEF